MSQAANDLEKMLQSTLNGVTGLLKVATDKIDEAKASAKTDEQRKEFAEHFVKSGVLSEFNSLAEKLKNI